MAEDIIKPAGATKASQNDAGGGVIRSEPVIGIVKNNIDSIRSGRIQVYIQDMNGFDPDDSKNWVTVRFLSNFYGRTYGQGPKTGYGSYPDNPVSYGEWHSPPDIGTQVVCIFVNGDMNYGYYIGCVPEPEALTMVPAIGSVNSKVILNEGESKALAGATYLPVTNLNIANESLANNDDFISAPKPVHSYLSAALSQQGLIRDSTRGPITSSAQRETPSRVGWGVSTPGRPIYEGGFTDETIGSAATSDSQKTATKIISRRAGHTFVMDDGDLLGKDQLIRLRTALGHQILMSDDGKCLFIIHANGQSWIELGAEGTIDMFSTNSVNIRTQGDLNLHADNNVNIHAEKDININAKENINVNSEKETSLRTGTNFKHDVLNNFTTKVGAGMSMGAGGEGSYASSSTMFINGSKINLNTGQTSLSPLEVKPIPLIAQTDTLFDAEKGFAPVPGKLMTIASRAPAHHPWPMANKGVDVKTNMDASANLPTSPSPAVDSVNNAVPSNPSNPVTTASTATVPNVGSTSSAIDATTTAAMVGAVATTASVTDPTAVLTGSSITDGVAKVGQLAQTSEQLVTGGTLKPGSETLINGLIESGASVTGAMTTNMFTGTSGIQSLEQYVANTTVQVQSQVTNFTQSQIQLVSAGVLTGTESSSAIAGIVMSGSQNGITATTDFIKTISSAGAAAGTLATQLSSQVNGITQSISSGNFASSIATNVSGALSGIAGSLGDALNNAKGVAASAFNSIIGAYKTFKPGVPQNLKSIAEGTTNPADEIDPYAGLTPEQLEKLGGADPTDPFIRSRLGLPALGSTTETTSQLSSSISNSLSSATTAAANLLSAETGLQGIPGGEKTISSVINYAEGATNIIPGVDALSATINNTSTALMNNISTATVSASNQITTAVNSLTSPTSLLPSGATSLISGATSSLTSGATSLISGATSSLTSGATSLLSGATSLLSGSTSLLSSATAMLPKDLAAQLNSAINALSSSGPTLIKLPTIAENTVNRETVTAQIDSILGNPKIPPPNYGTSTGVTSYYDAEIKKLEANKKKKDELYKKANAQYEVAMAAKKEYETAINDLPEGDPGIVSARVKYFEEKNKWLELINAWTDTL